MNARLEQRKGNRPLLTVFYNNDRRDWPEQIRLALQDLGVQRDQVSVICLPESMSHEGR